MILNLRHITLSVTDLDAAISFYVGLGATLVSQDTETGGFISHLIGVSDCSLLSAKLHLPDGNRLELMQFLLPEPPQPQSPQEKTVCGDMVFLGLHHLAFTVTSISSAIERIQKLGGQVISEPKPVPRTHSVHAIQAIHCYVRDPFGNIIHLAEYKVKL
jgi:catechol 2,3-dioxygenase-like lactoylglutathione lyase family enzyme